MYLLMFSFFLEIQSVEEQRSQFEDVMKQLEDTETLLTNSKALYEDTKVQLEDTKVQLEDTKVQFEDTKVQLEDTKAQLEDCKDEISKLEKKLVNIEYAKNPCKNCKGPTVCLDGQVLCGTPVHGTMIRAVKDTIFTLKKNNKNTEVKLVADDFGTVDTVRWGRTVVKWNTLGNYLWNDFTGFVYKCK